MFDLYAMVAAFICSGIAWITDARRRAKKIGKEENKMSIYISGVEIPKEHPLYITLRPDGSVHVWDSYSGEGYGTQAISVPKHGKLIDADAAIANRNADMNWCYDLYDLPDYLADCPAIIPADKGERDDSF